MTCNIFLSLTLSLLACNICSSILRNAPNFIMSATFVIWKKPEIFFTLFDDIVLGSSGKKTSGKRGSKMAIQKMH